MHVAAYDDKFWMIIGWVLGKKVLSGLNKSLLESAHNAIINIVIYSFDFIIFVWKWPFRFDLAWFILEISLV